MLYLKRTGIIKNLVYGKVCAHQFDMTEKVLQVIGLITCSRFFLLLLLLDHIRLTFLVLSIINNCRLILVNAFYDYFIVTK